LLHRHQAHGQGRGELAERLRPLLQLGEETPPRGVGQRGERIVQLPTKLVGLVSAYTFAKACFAGESPVAAARGRNRRGGAGGHGTKGRPPSGQDDRHVPAEPQEPARPPGFKPGPAAPGVEAQACSARSCSLPSSSSPSPPSPSPARPRARSRAARCKWARSACPPACTSLVRPRPRT